MMLSQKILSRPLKEKATSKSGLQQFRMDVIGAAKYVLPDATMSSERPDATCVARMKKAGIEGLPTGQELKQAMEVGLSLCIQESCSKTVSKYYTKMGHLLRLPYPTIFVENATVGILLKSDDGYVMTMRVYCDGIGLQPETIRFDMRTAFATKPDGDFSPSDYDAWNDEGSYAEIRNWEVRHEPGAAPSRFEKQLIDIKRNEPDVYKVFAEGNGFSVDHSPREISMTTLLEPSNIIAMFTMAAAEMLMFIHTKNITVHKYATRKKDFSSPVSKQLLAKFEYRILDIFRERESINNAKEIEDFMENSFRFAEERRAHMVAGHWKTIKGQIYWWSDHMRCRKNIDDVGYVAKDYRIRP